ncbi:hypothetical protein UVI_02029700 [Ustilaginoidea virens]|uniref:Uncharacterized protein n=1 Tax=Ustilaginoidea virens TaxID=1159556 RepID=A0A1B5KYD1_USTVR|nr:hypothetical protein UVI_02029700 [Ustilaginoidea virens]
MRPSCEACQVFQCPCIYDAVPKKRGPKTDVLEALLKRVDGLEAKLKEKNAGEHPSHTGPRASKAAGEDEGADVAEPACKKPALESRGQSDESEPRLLKSLEPCLRLEVTKAARSLSQLELLY